MKLVYYPDPILDQKLDDVNLEDPGFDPVELKEQIETLTAQVEFLKDRVNES